MSNYNDQQIEVKKSPEELQRCMIGQFRKDYLSSMAEYEDSGVDFEIFRLHVNQVMLGLVATVCDAADDRPNTKAGRIEFYRRHLNNFTDQANSMFMDLIKEDFPNG